MSLLEIQNNADIRLLFLYLTIDVRNNFMRKRVTAKSNDFKSLFGKEKHSIQKCILSLVTPM